MLIFFILMHLPYLDTVKLNVVDWTIKYNTTDNTITVEWPHKKDVYWTKVFSIQLEEEVFAPKTKKSGTDGTEYSGGPMVLTFSVLFRSTWLDKGWKNKVTSFVASLFLLNLSLWLMKTVKTVYCFFWFSLDGEGTSPNLIHKINIVFHTRIRVLICILHFVWKLRHNQPLLILSISSKKMRNCNYSKKGWLQNTSIKLYLDQFY